MAIIVVHVKKNGRRCDFGWRVKGEYYNKWIKAKIKVTTTLTSSIQLIDG
jgi:hypothetical protein